MSGAAYRRQSWVDPRVEVCPSRIEGFGLFARQIKREGEVVAIWGGVVMTSEDILAGRARAHSIAEIGEGLCLASEETDEASPADFMNHSCDPNVWMQDEVTLVARREIAADEEVTIDYALWGGFPPWSECLCRTAACRGRVTGDDWKRADLQAAYEGHWSPYIAERIQSHRPYLHKPRQPILAFI